jgi:DNA mismatch repair ATPase MutL
MGRKKSGKTSYTEESSSTKPCGCKSSSSTTETSTTVCEKCHTVPSSSTSTEQTKFTKRSSSSSSDCSSDESGSKYSHSCSSSDSDLSFNEICKKKKCRKVKKHHKKSSSSDTKKSSSDTEDSTSSSESSDSKSGKKHKKKKGNVFPVRLVAKDFSDIRAQTDSVFEVSGTKHKTLELKKRRTYVFVTDASVASYRFFFTTDPLGGTKSRKLDGTPEPSESQKVVLHTKDLPNHFYYQSAIYEGLGGLIVLN